MPCWSAGSDTAEDFRIPTSAFVTLEPRLPFGGLTFSSRVVALIRQDMLDPLPSANTSAARGDVREQHRRYNEAAVALGGYLL